MMIPNLNFLIYYACVAKGGATILAEFNSKDADLGALAVKCLEKTPPFHSIFSHTVRSKTYIFLLDHSFAYFAIFDENLDNSEGLSFLKSVKDAFNQTVENNSVKKFLGTLNSHCFQGEFNPVFLQLLASNSEFETPNSPRMVLKLNHGRSGSLDSLGGKKIGSADDGDSGGGSGSSSSSSTRGLSRETSVVMHKNVLLSGELGKEEAKRV